jgi:hypothetical protein
LLREVVVTFSEKILDLRRLRIRQLDEAIEKTQDYLSLFPKDLYLPSKLEHLKSVRDSITNPDNASVIHIEELKAYRQTLSR